MKHNVKLFFSDKYEDITDLFYAKRKELGGQTKSGHPPPYLNNGKFKPYKNEVQIKLTMWLCGLTNLQMIMEMLREIAIFPLKKLRTKERVKELTITLKSNRIKVINTIRAKMKAFLVVMIMKCLFRIRESKK